MADYYRSASGLVLRLFLGGEAGDQGFARLTRRLRLLLLRQEAGGRCSVRDLAVVLRELFEVALNVAQVYLVVADARGEPFELLRVRQVGGDHLLRFVLVFVQPSAEEVAHTVQLEANAVGEVPLQEHVAECHFHLERLDHDCDSLLAQRPCAAGAVDRIGPRRRSCPGCACSALGGPQAVLKPPRVTDHDIPARGQDSGAEQAYASLKAPAQGHAPTR